MKVFLPNFFLQSNYLKMNNLLKTIFLIFVITTIIFIIFFYSKKDYNEHFDSEEIPISGKISFQEIPSSINQNITKTTYQTGVSDKSSSGTILFTKPFSSIPFVFTQINGNQSNDEIAYSISIYNITNSSFDYYKNKVINLTINDENITDNVVVNLEKSKEETFNWIAFLPSTL